MLSPFGARASGHPVLLLRRQSAGRAAPRDDGNGKMRRAPSPVFFAGAGCAVIRPPPSAGPSFAPAKKRGEWSAGWRNHCFSAAFPFGERGRLSALHPDQLAPSGLICGDFCPRGRNFRARTRAAFGQPDPGSFRRPSSAPRPAHRRQSPVVGTDGDPGPPECRLAKPARGRHPCPTSRTPLEAPLVGQVRACWRRIWAEL